MWVERMRIKQFLFNFDNFCFLLKNKPTGTSLPAKLRRRVVATSVAVRNPTVATLTAGAVTRPFGPASVFWTVHVAFPYAISRVAHTVLATVRTVGQEKTFEITLFTISVNKNLFQKYLKKLTLKFNTYN